MKKSIVYVSNEWFIDTDITVLAELARDYTIHWLYYTDYSSPRFNIAELKCYAQSNGIILYLYDNHSKQLSWNLFKLQWKFIQKIRALKPDIVVRVSFHYYWALLSFLLGKFKVVYAFHDVISHSNIKAGFLDDLCRSFIINNNTYFILYSSTQYRYFLTKWPGKVVKNVGMSIKSYGVSNKKLPPLSDGVKLLFFGRIESYKGLDILINALEEMISKGIKNLQLSIYGKGPFWRQCECLIKSHERYNLNIRFVETYELADIFATHHFLVLPYNDSTQSGPLMIAVNYEMPILASKLEGFIQVYPIDCGVYYEKGKMTDVLEKVSKMNEDEYAGLKSKVAELKKLYSYDAIAANYKEFFESILE